MPGRVAALSTGDACWANIGREQREQNQEPRADEDHAGEDVGGPVHSQFDPREANRRHCQRSDHPRQRPFPGTLGEECHNKREDGEHEEGDGSVARWPR